MGESLEEPYPHFNIKGFFKHHRECLSLHPGGPILGAPGQRKTITNVPEKKYYLIIVHLLHRFFNLRKDNGNVYHLSN
jgi:hypothetical protein